MISRDEAWNFLREYNQETILAMRSCEDEINEKMETL